MALKVIHRMFRTLSAAPKTPASSAWPTGMENVNTAITRETPKATRLAQCAFQRNAPRRTSSAINGSRASSALSVGEPVGLRSWRNKVHLPGRWAVRCVLRLSTAFHRTERYSVEWVYSATRKPPREEVRSMEIRHATHPSQVSGFGTADLRGHYLVEDLFPADRARASCTPTRTARSSEVSRRRLPSGWSPPTRCAARTSASGVSWAWSTSVPPPAGDRRRHVVRPRARRLSVRRARRPGRRVRPRRGLLPVSRRRPTRRTRRRCRGWPTSPATGSAAPRAPTTVRSTSTSTRTACSAASSSSA